MISYEGSASAVHQIEGDNTNSNYWRREQKGELEHKSGKACNSYVLYKEDIELFKSLTKPTVSALNGQESSHPKVYFLKKQRNTTLTCAKDLSRLVYSHGLPFIISLILSGSTTKVDGQNPKT